MARATGSGADPRLLPAHPPTGLGAARVAMHTVYSSLRDYESSPPGESSADPLFIIGSPRSGTTFLGDVFSAVPGYSYHFEPVAVKAAVPYIYLRVWDDRRSKRWFDRTYGGLLRLHRASRKRIVDKTPRNVFISQKLVEWYPNAQFLFIARDGRDVATSWAEKPWLGSEPSRRFEPGGYRYGPDPHFWVEAPRIEEFVATTTEHRCAWGWRRHMEHWASVRRGIPEHQRFEMSYEELADDPHDIAGRLGAFLDLDGSAVALLAERMARVSPTSVGRWVDGPIAVGDSAYREMQPMLEMFGYL